MLTQTKYYEYNPTWNNINNEKFEGLTYGDLLGTTVGILASPCVDLYDYTDEYGYDPAAYHDLFTASDNSVSGCTVYTTEWWNDQNTVGIKVRPLVSLDSNIKIIKGEGTAEKPWQI